MSNLYRPNKSARQSLSDWLYGMFDKEFWATIFVAPYRVISVKLWRENLKDSAATRFAAMLLWPVGAFWDSFRYLSFASFFIGFSGAIWAFLFVICWIETNIFWALYSLVCVPIYGLSYYIHMRIQAGLKQTMG